MKKCVITVVGKDTVGIIAKVCEYLAGANVNILDISQTIVDGYFNMMTIVDVTNCSKEVAVVSKELEEIGTSIISKLKIFTERQEKHMINRYEVYETNQMIAEENLDVRTITLGISLLDCIDADLDKLNENIYNKITTVAKDLVKTGEEIEQEFGIPLINESP